MKRGENITALAEELGIARRQVYLWREELDPIEGKSDPTAESPREPTLRKANRQIKQGSSDGRNPVAGNPLNL
jgi:transposase-like protein